MAVDQGAVAADKFESLKGVKTVVRVSAPFKLVSREVKPEDTVIQFDNGVSRFNTRAGLFAQFLPSLIPANPRTNPRRWHI